VGFAQGGPNHFNRYMYTYNDPINRIDPDGRAASNPDDFQIDATYIDVTENDDGSITETRMRIQGSTSSTGSSVTTSQTGSITRLPQTSANNAPAEISDDLKEKLFNFSQSVGETVEVTSGIRTEEQNRDVGGARNSSHLTGDAADIRIQGRTAEQTADAAHRSGQFTRVNEYTDGRGVHVDTLTGGNQGRFTDWVHEPDPD